MKRLYFLLLLTLCLPCCLPAQGLWGKFILWLKEGSVFDSTYIYQRPAGFQVSVDGSAQLFSANLTSKFTTQVPTYDDQDEPTGSKEVNAKFSTDFSDNVNGGLGIGAAYGKLGLGFDVISWPKTYKKSSFNFRFGYQGNKWGINLALNEFRHSATNTLTIGDEGSDEYSFKEWQTNNPCEVLRTSADAYWIINRRRFSYTSAYKCDMVQRRSMGSFLICAGLVFSAVQCEEGDALLMDPGYKGYASFMNSVGAGYSHNFVLKHQDVTGPRNEGLFNITLNLTLMPMLTYSSTIYAQPMEGESVEIASTVTPNACGNAALGVSVRQWFFTLQYRHNLFYFHSAENMSAADLKLNATAIDNVNISGLMHDWRLTSMAVFNF